jgi:hypothetical protein
MPSAPCQGDPTIDFEPDPVHGFAYSRELPPDVPPGMTLDEWRRADQRRVEITSATRVARACTVAASARASTAARAGRGFTAP